MEQLNSLLYIRLLQSIALAFVLTLKGEGEQQGDDAKASKHTHWQGVVVLDESLSIHYTFSADTVLIKQPTNEQRYETETDILHPENEGVGRA